MIWKGTTCDMGNRRESQVDESLCRAINSILPPALAKSETSIAVSVPLTSKRVGHKGTHPRVQTKKKTALKCKMGYRENFTLKDTVPKLFGL